MITHRPTDSTFDIIQCDTLKDAKTRIKDSKFHNEYNNGVYAPTYEIYTIKKVKRGAK